jgi:hypothetical protein
MAMKLERILLGNSTAAGPSRLRVMKVDITVSHSTRLRHTQLTTQSDFTCPFCLLAVKQLQLGTSIVVILHKEASS